MTHVRTRDKDKDKDSCPHKKKKKKKMSPHTARDRLPVLLSREFFVATFQVDFAEEKKTGQMNEPLFRHYIHVYIYISIFAKSKSS